MSGSPEDSAFTVRAERILSSVEKAIDGVADDLDIDVLRSGNVITLAFENGHRIVVNSQGAAHEIWLAARSGGFHYRWDETSQGWTDTRSSEDLRVVLARLIALEVGVAPALRF